MSRQFELNKALFEAVTACFDYHIDLSTCTNVPHGLQNATLTIRDPKSKKNRMDAIHMTSLTSKGATP